MTKDYVQKYLWRDYGQPFLTAWQITLTADEAVAFLAEVCVLITYTQAKTWSLARRAVIRFVRPIQLPLNDDDPRSLARLSQYDAMSRLFSDAMGAWRRSRQRNNMGMSLPSTNTSSVTMTKTSPLFGIVAMVNTTLFVIMGVLVPWLLTGGLETPIVQSRLGDGCSSTVAGLDKYLFNSFTPGGKGYGTSETPETSNLYVAGERYRQCWQQKFMDEGTGAGAKRKISSCARVDGPILDRPSIRISHQPASCTSFTNRTCLGQLSQFQLVQENLTLRDYGINVANSATLLHSRRLTCTPLPELPVFVVENQMDSDFGRIAPGSGDQVKQNPLIGRFNTINYHSSPGTSTQQPNLTIQFYRKDGRLECPGCEDHLNGYLGERKFRSDDNYDAETFFFVHYMENEDTHIGSVNSSTRRLKHGQVFAILEQGDYPHSATGFTPRRYDLFDSNLAGKSYGLVMCREQHRICLDTGISSTSRCLQFTQNVDAQNYSDWVIIPLMEEYANQTKLGAAKALKDQLYSCNDLFYRTSTFDVVQQTGKGHWNYHPWTDFLPTPWTLEAMKWFEGALLLTRFNLHSAITDPLTSANSMKDGALGHRDSLSGGTYFRVYCQRGVFLDSDYTNINLIGLLMTILTIITINTVCHWRGHKTAARWVFARAVTASRTALSTMKNVFMKLFQFGGMILSRFIINFPFFPFIHRVPRPQSSRGGHNGLTNDEGTRIDLTPRSANSINGQIR